MGFPTGIDLAIGIAGLLAFISPITDTLLKKDKTLPWYKRVSKTGYVIILIGLAVVALSLIKSSQDEISKLKDENQIKLLQSKVESEGSRTRKEIINSFQSALSRYNPKAVYNYTTNTIIEQTKIVGVSFDVKKLNTAFDNLESPDYTRREIGLNYIINNFPDTLSDDQLKKIIKADSYFHYSTDNNSKINDLLMTQKKSKYLESYFKNALLKNNQNEKAWHYLFRNDVNIDPSFVISTIELRPNYWLTFANVVQYSMDNKHICTELLNSHELISFLLLNGDKAYQNQAYEWINKMIDRNSIYM